jgi:hypothetical protein
MGRTGERLHLDMIKDVVQEKTPDMNHAKLYARINLLESDMMAVQQYALNAGTKGAPGNIDDKYFDEAIKGEGRLIVNKEIVGVVDSETRRKQAREYFQIIRNRVLGSQTYDQWQENLGFDYDVNGKLVIKRAERIDEVWESAKDNGITYKGKTYSPLLTADLANREFAVHMGLEDAQLNVLDWATLGERHWLRRGNDLEARVNTTLAMIQYLDQVKAHPDDKELIKGLETIWKAEKEHDPAEAEKFVWIWAGATGEMYREGLTAKIPFVGKILPALGVPQSIMQHLYGADSAKSWSANNCHNFVEDVMNATHMTKEHIDKMGNIHPFNTESLEKRIGGTKRTAIIEFAIIGGALIVTGVALAALLKGFSEQGDEQSHH